MTRSAFGGLNADRLPLRGQHRLGLEQCVELQQTADAAPVSRLTSPLSGEGRHPKRVRDVPLAVAVRPGQGEL